MLDERKGWTETSGNLEYHKDIPIVKLQVDFSPKAFNVWHRSLFTDKLDLTINNCIKVYKVCDYYNDAKILSVIEAFMKSHIDKVNPFELIDLNINDMERECIEKIRSFNGRISKIVSKNIRRMKISSIKKIYNAVASSSTENGGMEAIKKEEILKMMTLTLVNAIELKNHAIEVVESVDFQPLEMKIKMHIYD